MDDIPTFEEIKKFKVVELKARLSSLGLHTSGKVEDNPFRFVIFQSYVTFEAFSERNRSASFPARWNV